MNINLHQKEKKERQKESCEIENQVEFIALQLEDLEKHCSQLGERTQQIPSLNHQHQVNLGTSMMWRAFWWGLCQNDCPPWGKHEGVGQYVNCKIIMERGRFKLQNGN